MSTIKLKSTNGRVFEVETKVAKMSATIKGLLEDLDIDDEENQANQEPIPLMKVDSMIFEKVLKWMEYHIDDPQPAEDDEANANEKRTDDISSWDKKFLEADEGKVFEIILAANFLNVKGLFDIASKFIANKIKGKSVDEIRKTFNIPVVQNN